MDQNRQDKDLRLALLIDADNVSAKHIRFIMDEVSKFGKPTTRRIYGDFTRPNLGSWKDVLLEYSINPVQQYSYTTGKNSSDSALIIDAMDILYSENVDGFCLVSSDSDFTRLASRLKESGMFVMGIGENKTPRPFIAACEVFRYIEVIAKDNEKKETIQPATKQQAKGGASVKTPAVAPQVKENHEKEKEKPAAEELPKTFTPLEQIYEMVRNIICDDNGDDTFTYLSQIGNMLNRKFSDFDPRNYGYQGLRQLIQNSGLFEEKINASPNNGPVHYLYRNKSFLDQKAPSGRHWNERK